MFEHLLDVNHCECGKNHSLTTRDYIVEKDALEKLPQLLQKLKVQQKPLAIYDQNTYHAAFEKLDRFLPDVDTLILQGDVIHADETQVEAIAHAAPGHSVLLAVGSGVINDTVRYVGFEQNIPTVSVPTAASADGFVSNSSVMTFNGAKRTIPTVPPTAVVADLEIIAAAPQKLTAAGVGDMLSKYISVADWHVGHLIAGEYYCPFVANLEISALDLIVKQINGIAQRDIPSMGSLVEGLLLSGLAMQMVQITRPASSFEHHFSHFLDVVPMGDNIDCSALHGEKVGIGSIIAAKYYPVFAASLERIFKENLSNQFSLERVHEYYKTFPQGVVDLVLKENASTATNTLDASLLQKNFARVMDIANGIPSPKVMRDALLRVHGYTDYREIGITPNQFRHIMKICSYIRNRFTMLRLISDYELFDFSTMDD
ncbi:sn-glycerol-1-phosphate dehydrogenase [Christensenellaceae bacterium OttesenSCG-928-K19]|nr:sn-glycerol-1-phosphate dehydrogenase [Christensenellaceae bacterium OttesenSCG-928-K19]